MEPRSRKAEMDTTLQARIYDPLWLLARQWQFGEFEGEDNGLPIMAGWRGESARLTRHHAGAIAPNTRVTAQSYDVTRTPRWTSSLHPFTCRHRYFRCSHIDQPSSELGAPHSRWRMFHHFFLRGSGLTTPASNLFFLPPSLVKALESRPIEEALFLRDEMANLAWGVERLTESPSERALNRFEAYLEQKGRSELEKAVPSSSASEPLRYRLSREVPDYWVPLMPVRKGQGLRLKRGRVLKADGSPEVKREGTHPRAGSDSSA